MPDLAVLYATFRGSKAFLVGLVAFVGTWLAFHFIVGFDADFGALNTILSTEASVSLAFFTMVSDRQSRAQQKQAEAMAAMISDVRSMAESLIGMAEGERCMFDEIVRMLKTQQMRDYAQMEQLKNDA